jgi:hypothetical protein
MARRKKDTKQIELNLNGNGTPADPAKEGANGGGKRTGSQNPKPRTQNSKPGTQNPNPSPVRLR